MRKSEEKNGHFLKKYFFKCELSIEKLSVCFDRKITKKPDKEKGSIKKFTYKI